MTTDNYQLIVLSSDGIMALVSSTDAGYYLKSADINDARPPPMMCPAGTYKS